MGQPLLQLLTNKMDRQRIKNRCLAICLDEPPAFAVAAWGIQFLVGEILPKAPDQLN
jgi:hypothetical protein